jgi:hypothetical protein
MNRSSLFAMTWLLVACAGNSGTKPQDASAADHDVMAQREERAAEAHGAGLDQNAIAKSAGQCGPGAACWTSSASPTDADRQQAQRHRELAAKHRAASAALVSAEQQACVGISEDDRDISPFYHRADIASVSVLEEPVKGLGRQSPMRTSGAVIEFRAVPGLSAEWLQRVVDCHIARAGVMGHEMPEMDYCPLVLKGVKATVSSTGNGFAVKVTSDDADTVKEIIRRAQALKP